MNRRDFISASAGWVGWSVGLPVAVRSAVPVAPLRPSIVAFSKSFRELSYENSAQLCVEVGWDGLEVPVRAQSSHVPVERFEEELPKFCEALQVRGKKLWSITTDITQVSSAAEKLLRTAAKLGITQYRMGFQYYDPKRLIDGQLREVGAALKDLAALNHEIGIQGGFQNHSGAANVGAAVWDLWSLIRDLDSKSVGICFDIAHATIEGGLSWPTEFRLVQSNLSAVYVKDFRWEKTEKGTRMRWCPLGEGMIHREFFQQLAKSGYRGVISQHHEYDGLAEGTERLKYFRKDLSILRQWLESEPV